MKLYFIIILFISPLYSAYTQQITIKNKATGEPLESVAIFNQGKNSSCLSDENGVASLSNFNPVDTLFFQHPSYERFSLLYSEAIKIKTILLERKNIIIPEFVITASKHRENKREIPYLVDVISPKKIDLIPAQNSADILTSTGNIFIQKSQAGGGSPVIRGFEANKVLLVIDGVRMNNAIYRSGHLQNSLTIDNAVLNRVEVIYGPTSVIYGSDALGGVVHYITKDPKLADTNKKALINGSAYVQAASVNKSWKAHFDLNFGFRKVAFLSSFTQSKFGDITMGYRRNPFLGDWGRQFSYVERINGIDSVVVNSNPNVVRLAGYEQIDILQKIKYKPNNSSDFVLNFQYSTTSDLNRHDQLNNIVENGDPEYAEWYYGPQKRLLGSVKSTFYSANNLFNTLVTTVAYQDVEESRITRGFREDTMFTQVEGVRIGSGNFDFYKEMSAKSNISYGLDLNYNIVSSGANKKNILIGNELPDITRYPDDGTTTMATGAYVSYKRKLCPKLLTSIGVRFQNYVLQANYGEFYSDLPDEFRDVKLTTQAMTSSLSFVVNQTRSFKWNIIFSTGFRSPNLDDLAKIRLTSGKLTLPNRNLVPEYSYNAEGGISKTLDGYIQINVNYFFTYLTDAIVRVPYTFADGSDSLFFQGKYRSTYQNINSSEALLHGFSMNLISDLNSDISFKSTLNYTYGRNLSDNTPLAHIPPIFGRTNFTYEIDRFVAEIYFIYTGWKYIENMVTTGEDKEDEATIHGFPGWYTINFNSSFNINRHIIFQLAIENLTDNFYKPFASGVPAPGINFIGTLRVKL